MSPSLWNDEPERPLRHLRVLDMTVMLPGPFVTRLLAQYGAQVVKMEPLPNGDAMRGIPDNSVFHLLNQGKRSLAMNLRSPETQQTLRMLAQETDVFIENYKEGVLDSLGLGYSDLALENPELMYVSLRGFAGKNSKKAGHDLNFIANSGVGDWFLENGHPNYSTMFGDMIGGAMGCALKLSLHLSNPDRRGMHLITSMEESFRTLYLPRAFESARRSKNEFSEPPQGIYDWTSGNQPHSRFYLCQDGKWISLNAIQPKHWEIFCEGMGHEDWISRQYDPALIRPLMEAFQTQPSTSWEARFADQEVCLFRVVSWEEHLESGLITDQLLEDPFAWAGFAGQKDLLEAPEMGQDTFAILTALGHSNREIADWIDKGVAWQAPSATPRLEGTEGLPID